MVGGFIKRSRFGHGDLADAVVTAIFLVSKKPNKPKRPVQKIHYKGLGTLWVEEMPLTEKRIVNIEVERY